MSWLSRFFGGARRGPTRPTRPDATPEAPTDFTLRRFDVAKNNTLSRDAWRHAHNQSINADLAMDLESVQARSAHEYANNPIYHGVVNTYALHVVGKMGPTLQVTSDDADFNAAVEEAWRKVFAMPDPNGRLSGPAGLKVLVKHLLVAGSSLCVFKQTRRDGVVKFGWQTIHPRRLRNPAGKSGDPLLQMGVEFDAEGRRLAYHIDSPPGVPGPQQVTGLNTKRVPADLVQHVFFDEEGEQVTGYPKMTSALETATDLREYDRSVLKAADVAAKHAVGLEAVSPESLIDPDPLPAGETLPIAAGMINVAPMGWRFSPLAATQPMAVYGEFRSERHAEIGRPIHMPLMLVILSSRHSNFASAQFDGSIYAEGINDTQGMIELQHLNGCVEQVIVELVLAGVVRRPAKYTLSWSWPKPPHANIDKITKALRSMLEDGGISLIEYCAALGYDYEQVLANRERVASELDAKGLPPSPVNTGKAPAVATSDDDQGAVEGDEPPGEGDDSQDDERAAAAEGRARAVSA